MWLNSGRLPRERSLLSTSNLNFLCFEALTNIRYFKQERLFNFKQVFVLWFLGCLDWGVVLCDYFVISSKNFDYEENCKTEVRIKLHSR